MPFSRLTHEQYNILTSKIINLFPTEFTGSYYVPAIRKCDSPTGRPVLAKGKLVDKCKNLIYACGSAIPKLRKRTDEGSLEEVSKAANKDIQLDAKYFMLIIMK